MNWLVWGTARNNVSQQGEQARWLTRRNGEMCWRERELIVSNKYVPTASILLSQWHFTPCSNLAVNIRRQRCRSEKTDILEVAHRRYLHFSFSWRLFNASSPSLDFLNGLKWARVRMNCRKLTASSFSLQTTKTYGCVKLLLCEREREGGREVSMDGNNTSRVNQNAATLKYSIIQSRGCVAVAKINTVASGNIFNISWILTWLLYRIQFHLQYA